MGYRKIITYILQSEPGSSLKASNFVCEGEAGGETWTGSRARDNGVPKEKKTRWSRELNPGAKAAPKFERKTEIQEERQMSIFDYKDYGSAATH